MSQQHDVNELCAYAIAAIKRAGFQRRSVSSRTEATYWFFPGRDGVLRISAHKHSKRDYGLDKIISKITFRGNCLAGADILVTAIEKVDNTICMAIGQYMIEAPAATSDPETR